MITAEPNDVLRNTVSSPGNAYVSTLKTIETASNSHDDLRYLGYNGAMESNPKTYYSYYHDVSIQYSLSPTPKFPPQQRSPNISQRFLARTVKSS